MPLRESVSEQLLPVLEWLAAEPDADPVADLAALRGHLTALPASIFAHAQGRECVELLAARALDVCERFKSRLLNAALPLPRAMNDAAAALVGAMLDLAGYFLRLAESALERRILGRRPDPAVFVSRGLRLVHEAFLTSAMSGTVAPPGLWLRAYELFLADGGRDNGPDGQADTGADDVALHFKRLLTLSALQPESLTARELAWSHDYLGTAAAAAAVSRTPVQPTASAFWLKPSEDAAPVAMVRANPPADAGLLHFSAHGVSRRAAAHADWLKVRLSEAEAEGEHRGTEVLEPDAGGLPVGLTPLEALSLLERMRDRWASPPNRTQPRRAQEYTVQVCAGLRAIWEATRRGADAVGIAEWMVCNESPGGYAVMAVSGVAGGLCAGMPLALRRDAEQPWSICLVRWIRSDNPERAELGLQLIAQSCTPVTVGFRGGDVRLTTPALILPPTAALRRNQAILAPAGTYTSRGFSLVHEGEHVYVAQARVLSLDMQTANVELFQYEIDPYPG